MTNKLKQQQLEHLIDDNKEYICGCITALQEYFPYESSDCDEEGCWLEVRIQAHDGDISFHYGDPQYDTDHRGEWGGCSISTETDCQEAFEQLKEELLESAAIN